MTQFGFKTETTVGIQPTRPNQAASPILSATFNPIVAAPTITGVFVSCRA